MKTFSLSILLCVLCTVIIGQPITPKLNWPRSVYSSIERYNPSGNLIPNKYSNLKKPISKKPIRNTNLEKSISSGADLDKMIVNPHALSEPYISNPNPNPTPNLTIINNFTTNEKTPTEKDSSKIKLDNILYNAKFYKDRGKFQIYSGIGCQVISAIIVFSNTTLEIHNDITISNGKKVTVSNSVLTTKSDAATYVAGGFALVGVILEISGGHNIKKSNLYLKNNGLVWKF